MAGTVAPKRPCSDLPAWRPERFDRRPARVSFL